MFKFIHAADIHLDSPLRGLSRYETAPVDTIRGACRRAFENLIDLAIDQRVAFVLLAGDLYDGDWKDFSTGIFIARQLARLGKHDIQVVGVAGNHDAASRITKSLILPDNVAFLSTKAPETHILDDLGVAIHGQGYSSKHVTHNLAAGFPAADPERFNIGLLHTSLDGREGHADYAPCTLDDLRRTGYQYWALGHVHQREAVSKDPWVVFPGCIQGRHAREAGAKGCTLVTVEDDTVQAVEHLDLDVVRWLTCRVDLEGVEDEQEAKERTRRAIEERRGQADVRSLAMRVRLEGACAVADELAAGRFELEEEIRAQAVADSGGELWIEKVELAVKPMRGLEAVLAEDSALGALLREISVPESGTAGVEGVADIVLELRRKLPAAAIGAETGLELDEPEHMARIEREARELLVGRLLADGGEG